MKRLTGAMERRISKLKRRFQKDGFRISDASNAHGFPFLYCASALRFGRVGMPTFLEEYYLFGEFGRLTSPLLHRFSDRAWQWAMENGHPMPGAGELGESERSYIANMAGCGKTLKALDLAKMSARTVATLVYVIPVAVSSHITREVLHWVRGKGSVLRRKVPARKGFLIPVIYDPSRMELHHFHRRPVRGKVFFTEAHRMIWENLYMGGLSRLPRRPEDT